MRTVLSKKQNRFVTKEIENFKDYLTSIITMDDDTFHLCYDFLKIENIKKGEFFVEEGKTCNNVAYIDQGLFRIYYLKDGMEVNTCFCKENSITSSFESLVSRTPSNQFIQAIEDSTLVKLSYENLNKLYGLSPIWQSVGLLMTEKECLRLSNRASSLSFETAMEKYKSILESEPDLLQRVSIQDIASYIGVSRETLSRIRAKIS